MPSVRYDNADIERVARALCRQTCKWKPDRIMIAGSGLSGHMVQPFDRPLWRDFIPDAKAAITAYLATH